MQTRELQDKSIVGNGAEPQDAEGDESSHNLGFEGTGLLSRWRGKSEPRREKSSRVTGTSGCFIIQ